MKETDRYDTVRALRWTEEGLCVLDQRKLPETVEYLLCQSAREVAQAIADMRVRGAPAIGIAAAYGVVLAARQRFAEDPRGWRERIEADLQRLAASRPTAVNLCWALGRMRSIMKGLKGDPSPRLLEMALRLHREDIAANRAMAEAGAQLLAQASGALTHCNTGSLATGGYGTALGVIRSAFRRGLKKIYATETRPWLQGARLTLWELAQEGIPATLIADSAAATLMRQGQVQWVVVGADRIAANGDVANKIGTYALAVLAKHHGISVMVVAPTSTIDWTIEDGAAIPIEQRDKRELLNEHYLQADSPADAWNPVFDITPAELIDALVTEKGTIFHPNRENMQSLRSRSGTGYS